MTCDAGGFYVYDGEDETGPFLGVFCGHRFPWNLLASGSHIYMKLTGVEWIFGRDTINVQFDTIGK